MISRLLNSAKTTFSSSEIKWQLVSKIYKSRIWRILTNFEAWALHVRVFTDLSEVYNVLFGHRRNSWSNITLQPSKLICFGQQFSSWTLYSNSTIYSIVLYMQGVLYILDVLYIDVLPRMENPDLSQHYSTGTWQNGKFLW